MNYKTAVVEEFYCIYAGKNMYAKAD